MVEKKIENLWNEKEEFDDALERQPEYHLIHHKEMLSIASQINAEIAASADNLRLTNPIVKKAVNWSSQFLAATK